MGFGWSRNKTAEAKKVEVPVDYRAKEHRLRFLGHLVAFLPLLVVCILAMLEFDGKEKPGHKEKSAAKQAQSVPESGASDDSVNATESSEKVAGHPNDGKAPESSAKATGHSNDSAWLQISLFFCFAATTVALESCFNALREFGEWVEFRDHEVERLLQHNHDRRSEVVALRKLLYPLKLELRWFKVKTAFSIVFWLVVGYCEARHVIGYPVTTNQQWAVGFSTLFVISMAWQKLWRVTGDEFALRNAVIEAEAFGSSKDAPKGIPTPIANRMAGTADESALRNAVIDVEASGLSQDAPKDIPTPIANRMAGTGDESALLHAAIDVEAFDLSKDAPKDSANRIAETDVNLKK